MIEEFSYDQLKKLSESLSNSSKNIRSIIDKHPDKMNNISDFCSSIDSYVNFIESSIVLYQDSEKALENIMKKAEN